VSAAGLGKAAYRLGACYCGGLAGGGASAGNGSANVDLGLHWLLAGAMTGDAACASAAAALLDGHANATRSIPAASMFRQILRGAD